ncbi:GNAT family N-acetyltransferase [Peribacillus butanolivorans]|uniref:GNAT family N-acetyltransferase n=1 Tax=Peribacillus butanolivorans TaxID=421767 RepID=UPI003660EDBA
MSTYLIRAVHSADELEKVANLQENIWGIEGRIPIPVMTAMIKNGGLIVAGMNEEEKCIGFALGFPSKKNDSCSIMYSHMLAISPHYRNQGIGQQLKLFQRKKAKEMGYTHIQWTFDPLEIKNGYLNINRIGADVESYQVNYYGTMKDKINVGMPSDRFIIQWDCQKTLEEMCSEKHQNVDHWSSYPSLLNWRLEEEKLLVQSECGDTDDKGLRIPVPKSINQLKREVMEEAIKWRIFVRNQILKYISKGYRIVGVLVTKEPVNYYIMEK